MKDKQFEQVFKDALGKYEAPHHTSDWNAMEKMLDDKPNNYLLLKTGEIVLVCAAVWFIANPFIQSKLDQNENLNHAAIVSDTEIINEQLESSDKVSKTELITNSKSTTNRIEPITSLYESNVVIVVENNESKTEGVDMEEKQVLVLNTNESSHAFTTEAIDKPSNDVLSIQSSFTKSNNQIQFEKDLAESKAHIAGDDIYSLNVAFNINGDSYSDNEKAWIIADINERSAKSLSRIYDLDPVDASLDNTMDDIKETEIAELQLKASPFIDQVNQNMIYGLEYSPDVSANSYSSNFQRGNTFGFNMKYEVNRNVRIVTGAHYYSYKMENPGFCMSDVEGFNGAVSVNNSTSANVQNTITSSDCFSHSQLNKRQIEIPFEADVRLNNFGKFSMYLNSGVSMYLINREYVDYHIIDSNTEFRDDGDFTVLLNRLGGPEESRFRLIEKNESGHVKMGLGLEYQIQPSVGIRVQPQLKIPVSFQDGFSTNLMRYSVATGLYYHF